MTGESALHTWAFVLLYYSSSFLCFERFIRGSGLDEHSSRALKGGSGEASFLHLIQRSVGRSHLLALVPALGLVLD